MKCRLWRHLVKRHLVTNYYVCVTIDKRLACISNLFIQLNYKLITAVHKWRIGNAKLKQFQLKSNLCRHCCGNANLGVN